MGTWIKDGNTKSHCDGDVCDWEDDDAVDKQIF